MALKVKEFTLENLHDFSSKMQAEVGCLSGRKFVVGSCKTTLTDLYVRLKELNKPGNYKDIPLIEKIIQHLDQKDAESRVCVDRLCCLFRIFLIFRSLLGNLRTNRIQIKQAVETFVKVEKENWIATLPPAKLIGQDTTDRSFNSINLQHKMAVIGTDYQKAIDLIIEQKYDQDRQTLYTCLAENSAKDKAVKSLNGFIMLLEKMEWPTEQHKEIILDELALQYIHYHEGFHRNTRQVLVNSYYLDILCLKLAPRIIFGIRYENAPESPLCPLLAKTLGNYIHHIHEEIAERLQSHKKTDIGYFKTYGIYVGLGVELTQFSESRFTAKMIMPLLPYLKGLPGLSYLEMEDIGVDHRGVTVKEGTFTDEHVSILKEIFANNSRLEFIVNTRSMTQKGIERLVDTTPDTLTIDS